MEHALPLSDARPERALRIPSPRSPWTAAILGWLCPGLGQVYAGRPDKALMMLVAIGGLYVWGLFLTAYTCVNPEEYGLEFVAHALIGGPTAITLYLTQGLQSDTFLPYFEVGRLYVAIAGLLNVVSVSDALGDVLSHNDRVAALRALQEDREREVARERAAVEWSPVEAEVELPPSEPTAPPEERAAPPFARGPDDPIAPDAGAERGVPE